MKFGPDLPIKFKKKAEFTNPCENYFFKQVSKIYLAKSLLLDCLSKSFYHFKIPCYLSMHFPSIYNIDNKIQKSQ